MKEYEKRDTPVTFRTSERKAAWIRDRARVENMDTSEYIDSVLTEHLENKERVRTPSLRTREAEEIAKSLKGTIDATLSSFTLMKAGTNRERRKRRIA